MPAISGQGHTARAAEWWRPRPRAAATAVAPATVASTAADEADRPAFRAILIFTVILLLAPQEWLPFLRPLRIALLTAGVALAMFVGGRLTNHRPVTIFPREMAYTAALVAWAVLTVPFSMHPGGSVGLLTDLYLKTLIVFWLVANLASSASRLRQVAWTLTAISTVPALTAMRNYASGNFLTEGSGRRIAGYDAALLSNPNDLALMLNLTLPLTATLLTLTRRRAARLLLLSILALQIVAIVLTFSRGGSITLGVILIALLWRFSKRRGPGLAVAVGVLALVAIPLLPSSYLDRLSSIDDMESDKTGSAQERWIVSVAAVNYIAGHPVIGTGIGQNTLALNQMLTVRWTQVHNVYLQIGMELGLPGLALFLALMFGCLRAARYAARTAAVVPGAEDLSAIAGAVTLSLVGYAVAAFFHPTAYHVYFYYFAALALAARVAVQALAPPAPAGRPLTATSSAPGRPLGGRHPVP
jgi:probable O-glycosylation ligase (exosortase A-associated)